MKTAAPRARVVTTIVLLAVLSCAANATFAQASPDEPAAIVVYPYVFVDSASGTDTLIQVSNTATNLVELRCFYEDFTPQCTGGQTGESCFPSAATCTGRCTPSEARIPFRVRATAQQPLAWYASAGLQSLPLPAPNPLSPGSDSNQFSNVPGVGSGPFVGTLRCVAITDDPYRPRADNVLVGQATIEHNQGTPISPLAYSDAAEYGAIGIKALSTGANRDEFLNLGGPDAEYEACPGVAELNHFFDGATLTTSGTTANVTTTLVLANCGARLPTTADMAVQFKVFNEFDQRFSTSRSLHGQLVIPLTQIDSPIPQRSIFSEAVSGTLTGHTRIKGIGLATGGGGLHAIAIESHQDSSLSDRVQSDAINLHGAGVQVAGDILGFRPRCIGDCNFDGNVTIDELILGVNIALETSPTQACPPIDANNDAAVTIDELVSAVIAALNGCPAPVPPPTAVATPTPTPPPAAVGTPTPTPPPAAVGTPTPTGTPGAPGPDITYFGFATADDRPLPPDSTDAMGRPVFSRPFGQGMTLIIEARPGRNGSPVGHSTYSDTGGLPDLQVLVSNPLGDGNPAVCEQDGHSGGIPAVPSLRFVPDPATVAAINDLGCRAYDRQAKDANSACTRTPSGEFAMVNPVSAVQFCIPIAKAWAFPLGDTVVAVRVRDDAGNLGPVREMVVRVAE
jgi:hypothetical protein